MRAVGPGGAGVQPGLGARGRRDLWGYVGLEGAGDGADPGRGRWASGAGARQSPEAVGKQHRDGPRRGAWGE